MSKLVALVSLAVLATACADGALGEDPEVGVGEGVDYDEENPNAPMDDGKSDAPRYPVPTDLPMLVAPEIIV